LEKERIRHNNLERIGVLKVAKFFTEDFNWIFRELSIVDVGIDAYIEEVINGQPTGKIIALQIKSGESNFYISNKDKSISFYFDKTHYDYWINYSLPVIIVGHLPNEKQLIWQLIDKNYIIKTKKRYKIEIKKKLSSNSKFELQNIFQPLFNLTIKENSDLKAINNFCIDEINLHIDNGSEKSNYRYPIVKTNNEFLEKTINYQINNIFFSSLNDEYDIKTNTETSESLLMLKEYYIKNFNGGVSSIGYEIYENQFDILSLSISFIYIGAYPSLVKAHLNFDLETGNRIELSQLIKPYKLSNLRHKLSDLKLKRLSNILDVIKKNHPNIRYFDNVKDLSIYTTVEDKHLNNFIVKNSSLKFELKLGFPHAMNAFEPDPIYMLERNYLQEILNPFGRLKNITN